MRIFHRWEKSAVNGQLPDPIRVPMLLSFVQLDEEIVVVVRLQQPRDVVDVLPQIMTISPDSMLNFRLQAIEIIGMNVEVNICIPIQHGTILVGTEQRTVCHDVAYTHISEDIINVEEQVAHSLLAARRHCPAPVDPVGHRAIGLVERATKMPFDTVGTNEVLEVVGLHEEGGLSRRLQLGSLTTERSKLGWVLRKPSIGWGNASAGLV
mmetsp:Transcript_288/g.621  ORF Transcript_288/g.621 Transcript_288/m.621 type:complete len:209 (+) Transcript_288:241-867(+)